MPWKLASDRAEANRRWRVANAGAVRTSQRAKAIRRKHGGTLATSELRAAMAEPCAYCGAEPEHVEHCTPIVRGGRNDADNVVSACEACNLRKGRQTVLEFLGLWPGFEAPNVF